jgi:hypothetical protein
MQLVEVEQLREETGPDGPEVPCSITTRVTPAAIKATITPIKISDDLSFRSTMVTSMATIQTPA